MNRKLLKVIIRCIGIVLIIGICGLFLANYAVVKVLDILSSESEVTATVSVQEDVVATAETNIITEQDHAAAQKVIKDQEPKKVQPSESTKDSKNDSTNSTKDNTSRPTGAITKQKVEQVQESLTAADKAKIITIMTQSLNRANSQELWEMAKGGLSLEEKQEAKEVLLVMLSPEDYNELSSLAQKYGISKGKTYDEAQLELNLQHNE